MALGRPLEKLVLSAEETAKLTTLARRPKSDQRTALRAGIVLDCASGLSNTTVGVCAVAIPNCTTASLMPVDADPSLYLWADGTRLAPGGQSQLAQLAIDRARRNPF